MNNTGGPSNRDNGHDEEDENIIFLTGAAVCAWYLYRNMPREPRIRNHTSKLSGILRVDNLLRGHPEVIFNKVRMYARTFKTLSAILEGRGLL